jgi:hypothetical protein
MMEVREPRSFGGFVLWLLWSLLWTAFRLVVGMRVVKRHDQTTHKPRATWFRSARAVERRPSLNPLDRYPGYYRQVWRLVLLALLYCIANYLPELIATVATVSALAAVWWWRRRTLSKHLHEVVVPLWSALAPLLGLKPEDDHNRYLSIPVGYRSDGATVGLTLPPDWRGSADQRAAIGELLTQRLGVAWRVAWHLDAFPMTAELARPAPLPRSVDWSEVMDDGPEHLVPVAMRRGGVVRHVDVRGETPHVVVTAPTRWGKSALIRLFVAWFRHHGADVVICDPKRVSLRDAFGARRATETTPAMPAVPGIAIHTDLDAMSNAIIAFDASMESYYRAAENGADIEDESRFPSRILVLDEMGTLTTMIKQDWKNKGGKGIPPALISYQRILWMGGFARHRVVAGAHQANLDVFLSSDSRTQFGAKFFTGPQDDGGWRMMFGNVKRIKLPRIKGRAVLGIGTDLEEIQFAFMTDDEAREFAMAGMSVPAASGAYVPGGMPGAVPDNGDSRDTETGSDGKSATASENAQENAGETLVQDAESDDNHIVGIAAGAAFLRMTDEAFRGARKRSPIEGETRAGSRGTPAWTPEVLLSWHSKRPIAGSRLISVPSPRTPGDAAA